jgi:Fe-Mn family superoxide dismutase
MFTLINLPYAPEALEPVISAKTLGFHHGKHLQGYVNNLNAALPGSPFEGMALEDIIRKADGGIFNNAGQILNHNLYFEQFGAPVSGDAPRGALAAQIAKQWGSLEAFQTEFVAKGAGLFGSGWVWLQADASGEMSIAQYAGADNPVAHGFKPLLTFDVWEHAYYLDYQNRRPDYLKALWPLVNWRIIEERYGK